MSKKAIYIGACTDTDPIVSLHSIKHFVMVDSMPLSFCGQFDVRHFSSDDKWINDLVVKFDSIGFKYQRLSKINTYPILRFYNITTDQSVHYYPMTIFPEMVHSSLKNDLQEADTLISIGHHPHKEILEYLTPSFDLIVKNTTYYGLDDTDRESIWLLEPNVSSRIQDIYDISKLNEATKIRNVNLPYLHLYLRMKYSNKEE